MLPSYQPPGASPRSEPPTRPALISHGPDASACRLIRSVPSAALAPSPGLPSNQSAIQNPHFPPRFVIRHSDFVIQPFPSASSLGATHGNQSHLLCWSNQAHSPVASERRAVVPLFSTRDRRAALRVELSPVPSPRRGGLGRGGAPGTRPAIPNRPSETPSINRRSAEAESLRQRPLPRAPHSHQPQGAIPRSSSPPRFRFPFRLFLHPAIPNRPSETPSINRPTEAESRRRNSPQVLTY
jgi:hypothetical protein